MAQDPAKTAPAPAWRDLRLRVASAVVLAPVGLAALWFGGFAWHALIVVMALGMAMEWSSLCRGIRMSALTATLLGVGYLGPAVIALTWLRDFETVGRANVMFVVLVVWASDIGAYLVGRMIGGALLAPGISPGKTWSGAVGGLLSAMLVGLLAVIANQVGAPVHAMLVGGCLGIAAQSGDLIESRLKRYFGVKDSGRLIPGHGGLLDRLDGLLLAAPLAAILALYLGRGMILWQ